ncbi:putative septum site-determining MinC [Gossypium arboreum]|uniref:Putative septum site-determining MinC n=1 Tax=Gossypium arboreum TaxID=29729 RepID=A0A0B0MRR5_GOSAR|nr:putative septum site-determining MinC [Gossypium arboreum]
MLILYVLPVAEYTGICYGYLTACVSTPSSYVLASSFVTKLAQVGDCRSSYHTIKLL